MVHCITRKCKHARKASKTRKHAVAKKYSILYNGDTPFVATVTPSHIEVYNRTHTGILRTTYKKLYVGDNTLNVPRHAKRGVFPGNSLLIQVTANRYIYVGSEVYEFTPRDGDTIVAYYSPVGNSQVPYPYAVGSKYAYFMHDKVAVAVDALDTKKDGYAQFYSNRKLEKIPMHTRMIAARDV
jgi:hypothetical protein